MAKTKRKINKQSVMQKQQWKYMRRRYPFLVPVRHWYTGMKMTKKEIKKTPPILSLESRDIPDGWVNRFGHELCEELRAELIRCGCLNSAFVMMAKEKFGELRLCLAGTPKECKADDMSHITKYILATYENYILTRPTESLQSEFDDTIKSEIDEGSIQPEDEEKVREIISHARTLIAKPAEATDNSASDETATDDEAVSLEDILG